MPDKVVKLRPNVKTAANAPQRSWWRNITSTVLERAGRKRQRGSNHGLPDRLFTAPLHPPGVFPDKQTEEQLGIAFDEAIDESWNWAEGAQSAFGSAFAEGVTFLGYPFLAALNQRPEYRVASETIAEEMTREWIEIKSKSDDKNKSDKVTELEDAMKRFRLQEHFCTMAEQDGAFGRAHLYIDLGIDTNDREELLSGIGNGRDTASKEKVKKGSLKAFRPVEAVWTYPTRYESNDPLSPDWYKPRTWYVMGKELDRSRILTFVGREVPDLLKPAYSFGGLSMNQMMKPYVDNWLRTRQSVSDLVSNFAVQGLKTNLGVSLMQGGDELFSRVELFNRIRDNHNAMVLDKETEEWFNVQTSLATLDELQAQAQEHMAAVSRIPLIKLLGISPHGLNATAEPEIRVFYDWIAAFQEHLFRVHLTTCLGFIQLNEWGEIDDDLIYVFKSLWQLDEAGKAGVEKTKADIDDAYLAAQVVSKQEVRQRLARDEDSPYAGLNLDPDKLPEPDPMMGGGMPGEPPMPGGGEGKKPDNDDDDTAEAPGFLPKPANKRSPLQSITTKEAKVGGAGVGGFDSDEPTLNKRDVRYTDYATNDAEQCEKCLHFRGDSGCDLVVGDISPEGWCIEWTEDVDVVLACDEWVAGDDVEFVEAKHPRDKSGKFAKTGQFESGSSEKKQVIKTTMKKVLGAHGYKPTGTSKGGHLEYTGPGGNKMYFGPSLAGQWAVSGYRQGGQPQTFGKGPQELEEYLSKKHGGGQEQQASPFEPSKAAPSGKKVWIDAALSKHGFEPTGEDGSDYYYKDAAGNTAFVAKEKDGSGNYEWTLDTPEGEFTKGVGILAGLVPKLKEVQQKQATPKKTGVGKPHPAGAVHHLLTDLGFKSQGQPDGTDFVYKDEAGNEARIPEKSLNSKFSWAFKPAGSEGYIHGSGIKHGLYNAIAKAKHGPKSKLSDAYSYGGLKIPESLTNEGAAEEFGTNFHKFSDYKAQYAVYKDGSFSILPNDSEQKVITGLGQEEFNAAFEQLHPRGAGGKFIAKPGTPEFEAELNMLDPNGSWMKHGETYGTGTNDYEGAAGEHIYIAKNNAWVIKESGAPDAVTMSSGTTLNELHDYLNAFGKPLETPLKPGKQYASAEAAGAAFEEAAQAKGWKLDPSQSKSWFKWYQDPTGQILTYKPDQEEWSLYKDKDSGATATGKDLTKLPAPQGVTPTAAPHKAVGPTLHLDSMKKIGPQLGSNEGGSYEDPDGNQYYVKMPATNDHARNETLAAALFAAGGGPTLNYHQVVSGDKQGIATDWATLDKSNLSELSPQDKAQARKDFALHAWLANWDVAGIDGANIGTVNGKVTPLDFGGALLYRAKGSPKGTAFGDSVTEWESLRSPSTNQNAAKLFAGITPDELKVSAAKLGIAFDTKEKIAHLVGQYGPGSPEDRIALTNKLWNRRNDIIKRASVSAPNTPPPPPKPVDPHELRAKIASWNPPGKPTYAVEEYKGSGYTPMNNLMRYFDPDELPAGDPWGDRIREVHGWLEKAKSKEAVTIFRGVGGQYVTNLKHALGYGGAGVGKVIRDPGFVSMSTSQDFSRSWGMNQAKSASKGGDWLVWKINAPAGAKMATVKAQNVSDGEYEVLGQQYTRFRITKWDPENNYVEMDMLPHKAAA